MKKFFVAILAALFLSILLPRGLALLQAKSIAEVVTVQNVLLHSGHDNDISDTENCGKPWWYIWSRGTGGVVGIRVYTSYICPRPGDYRQRIEVVNPKGNSVAESTRIFSTETVESIYGNVYMADLDEPLNIPAQDVSDKSRFGMWAIKIYVNDMFVREIPMPLTARRSDENNDGNYDADGDMQFDYNVEEDNP